MCRIVSVLRLCGQLNNPSGYRSRKKGIVSLSQQCVKFAQGLELPLSSNLSLQRTDYLFCPLGLLPCLLPLLTGNQ